MKAKEWQAIKTSYEQGYKDFVSDLEKQIDTILHDTLDQVDVNDDPQYVHNLNIQARAKIDVLKQILEDISGEEKTVVKRGKQVIE